MSRVIIINDFIYFEPEKKNFNSSKAHVHISAPAAYCFLLLIEKQGELVTHEELYQYAWRQFGMEATANTLYQNISVLRRGLEKCGLQEDIIRTMPRRGFILSPAVTIEHKKRQQMSSTSVVEVEEETTPISVTPAEQLSSPQGSQVADQNSTDQELIINSDGNSQQLSSKVSSLGEEASTIEPLKPITIKGLNPEVATSHNSDTKPSTLRRFRTQLAQTWLYLSLLLAGTTLIYLLVYVEFNPHFTGINYHYITTQNECEYYVYNDGEDDERVLHFIKGLNRSCPYGKYNYLTKFSEGGVASLINCKKKMSYFSGSTCLSEYFTGVKDD